MKIELSDDAFRLIKEVFFSTTIEAKNAKAYAYVQDELGRAEAGWKAAQSQPMLSGEVGPSAQPSA